VSAFRIAIVGAGLAGATAAVTLREEGFTGEIQVIGQERHLPYHRPPLSKGYLRGEEAFPDQLVKPPAHYADHDIELTLGAAVTALDPWQNRVELAGGKRVSYDKLLVATGGRNRTPTAPGAGLPGVLQLRTVDDCDRIRAAARAGRRAVVIGLGFIGSEVSASLRQLGLEVTAIDRHHVPLARVVGEEIGGVLRDIHREKGVNLALDDDVAGFEGSGRLERVRTRRGVQLECELAVVGIGIEPNGELLAAAGADVDGGVLVDEYCRTSLPNIHAAGDVTNHRHPVFGRLRVEHWNNADQQGRAAARSMLGTAAPYDYMHSFWSDQYEHKLEYVGFAPEWERLVFRGQPASRKFLGFYMKEGLVRAAVGLNRGGDPEDPEAEGELKAAAELIRARVAVDPARLADEDVPLDRLTGRGGG
jgi:3-phenylpropionate/trans-cinnamate dioxygenase ferredoxin reductase subunit